MAEKLFPYIDGLHVLPWLTDGAVDFIDGHLFWLKSNKCKNPRVFEFGSGNSTLYFLSRGCFVYSVDHDDDWARKIKGVSDCFGYHDQLNIVRADRPYDGVFEINENTSDLILIDGRDRVQCLESVLDKLKNVSSDRQPIIILDNTERVTGKYSKYIELLSDYNLINFEMPFAFGAPVTRPESRIGLEIPDNLPTNGLAANAYRDRSGNASKGRLITTIAVPKSRGEYTTQGIPLV